METTDLLTNRAIPDALADRAGKLVSSDEQPLFALVGDLDLKGRYSDSLLLVTTKRAIALDAGDTEPRTVDIADIDSAKVKRMYGNAVLRVTDKDGRTVGLLRSTFVCAATADAAAAYLTDVAGGGDADEALRIVRASYDKLRAFCPKCGRRLPSPGAECMHCASKKTVAGKLMKYVVSSRGYLAGSLLIAVVTTLMALAPPYLTKTLVDDVLPNRDTRTLLIIVGVLLGVYILQYSLGAVRAYLMRIASDRIVSSLRDDVYTKAQYLPMSFYDKTSVGTVIRRITNDTDKIQQFILRITQDAVTQLFTLVGIIIIMLTLNVKLSLLSLIPIPLVVAGTKYFGKRIQPLYRRIWRRLSAINSLISDTMPGVKVIKSFTNEKRASDKFHSYTEEFMREDFKAAKLVSIFPNAVTFFVTCGSLIIWGFGGRLTMQSSSGVTVGLLVSFITYCTMFYNPINFFASLNDTYQDAMTSVQKVFEIIDAEPESNFVKDKDIGRLRGRIEFKNVSFSYDKTKKTLSDINLTIEPGDIVGIVGTTGSGKSTLINLLLRFYDDYEGEILVDGHDIRDIDVYDYRSQIGYVQQEPMMFRDTIFNNIADGDRDASVEEVIHAADVANAHRFIARLPDGYDTVLGERGVGLSGGERQRLSIARAVLKNPSMLVFDEATASVDSETEHLIQEAVERLISGRTTLMIAHRLSTLAKANKIVVVDKGRIIECGSPEELMELKGKYYKLVQIQSMADQVQRSKQAENFE